MGELEGAGMSSSWRAAIESFNSASRLPELEVEVESELDDLASP